MRVEGQEGTESRTGLMIYKEKMVEETRMIATKILKTSRNNWRERRRNNTTFHNLLLSDFLLLTDLNERYCACQVFFVILLKVGQGFYIYSGNKKKRYRQIEEMDKCSHENLQLLFFLLIMTNRKTEKRETIGKEVVLLIERTKNSEAVKRSKWRQDT